MLKILKSRGHEGFLLKDLRKQGISNGELVKLAAEMHTITITSDADFPSVRKALQHLCRIIYIKAHPRNPPVVIRILEDNLDYSLIQLQQPGRVVLTESDRTFEPF